MPGTRALANRVACNVAALQGAYTAVLEPSYVLRGRDARTVSGPGAQGSSSTGSPSAIGPGATIEP